MAKSQLNGESKTAAAFLRMLADEIECQRVVSFEGVSWYGEATVQGIYRTGARQAVAFRCASEKSIADLIE